MPRLTRWMLRSSLIWLAGALLLQFAAALKGSGASFLLGVQPFLVHAFTVGWLTQLIFGVVHWMFPRVSPEHPRGNHALGWVTYIGLNSGLVLRGLGEGLLFTDPNAAAWILPLAASLQSLAGMGFVIGVWPRVRER
jgi:hypothetical protein